MTPSPLPAHRHDPVMVCQAIAGVVEHRTSLRGVVGWLAMARGKALCHDTVRNWALRLGYHLLHRPVPRRDDWVILLDHTLVLGSCRCLLVLGTSLRRWQASPGPLAHSRMRVLMVEVVATSNGAVVRDQLLRLIGRIGVPAQIVSDHGTDLVKGIELVRRTYPQIVDTYDVSHKLACLLRAELEPDPRWPEFIERAARARAFLRQAAGGVPRPPSLRTKARYQNLGPLVGWGLEILALDAPGRDDRLAGQRGTTAEEAGRWFDQKLGWVGQFADDLATWRGLLEVVERTRRQVNREGLDAASAGRLRAELGPTEGRIGRFAGRVVEFLAEQGRRVPPGRRYIGCGEVIESVFGKYKSYLERSPSPSLGTNVLLLPLLVTRITPELVAEALARVKHRLIRRFAEGLRGSSHRRLRLELRPPPQGAIPA